MAILRRENDLAVLQVRLNRRGRRLPGGILGPAVTFSVQVGAAESATEIGMVPPDTLGIRDGRTVSDRALRAVALPAEIVRASALLDALDGRSALWLEFPAPSGPLRMLPWEALLTPVGVPLLRLPYFALRPSTAGEALNIAVCASSPLAKVSIDVPHAMTLVVEAAHAAAPGPVTVHVFTDQNYWGAIHDALAHHHDVVVHDPHQAQQYALPRRTHRVPSTAALQNPWMLWMRDTLSGTAVDHVHFYGHGYLGTDSGAVALASSPMVNTDESLSRFVGSAEVLALLSTLGSWSVAFSGPPDNYSAVGLREIAGAVAEARPGPVLAHETEVDPSLEQLATALRLAWAGGEPAPLAGVALWVHPQLVSGQAYPGQRQQEPMLVDADSQSQLLSGATLAALGSSSTPTWVASTARIIEQAQAQWFCATQSDRPGAISTRDAESATAALRLASDLLERHVQGSVGANGPGTAR